VSRLCYSRKILLTNFTNISSFVCSNVSLFCWKTSVHAGNGCRCNATSYGDDTFTDIINAHSHTKSGSLSQAKWICHEHTATFDFEASMEAAESVGRLRQVLRTHTATKFRRYFAIATGTVSRSTPNGKQFTCSLVGSCRSFCWESGNFVAYFKAFLPHILCRIYLELLFILLIQTKCFHY